MNSNRRIPTLKSTLALGVLFIVAAIALGTSSVGGVHAARSGGASSHAQKKSGAPVKKNPVKKNDADASVAPVAVQELNEESLAKLLRQEGATARTPLLVNFWATWCDPCREEFPDLVEIDERYRPRGLQFVTISLDDVAEIKTSVPEFLTRMRATLAPAYLLNANDPEAAILGVDKEWRGELPATFLFDRTGQLVYKHKGRIKPAALRAAIDKTLNPK